MKTRPILFSAPMVRALLYGRKTHTRRVAKLNDSGRVRLAHRNWHVDDPNASLACPYGQPGDRLWVRETFCPRTGGMLPHMDKACRPRYRADGELHPAWGFKWTPAIHMPRIFSRIILAIDSVRLERLQDITEVDAIAEGALSIRSDEWDREFFPTWKSEFDAACDAGEKPPLGPTPKQTFQALWNSINGEESWKANPLVWVVEFHRIDKETGNV